MNFTFPDNNTYAKMVRCLVALVVVCLGFLASGNASAAETAEQACKSYQVNHNYQGLTYSHNTLWNNGGNADCWFFSSSNPTAPASVVFSVVGPFAPATPETCRGDLSPAAWLKNSGFYKITNPVCTWMDAQHVNASCSGGGQGGKPTTVEIGCNSGGNGITPGAEPSQDVDERVDFPDCPAGSYRYTDGDGANECTTPVPEEVTPQPCASGNVGSFNGNLVCLPANPAPNAAAAAAAQAKLQAAIAKQFPATPQAAEAAKLAAVEAQKAKDAANSLPGSAGANGSAQDAINSAKQAAGHAGTGYNGPGGVGTGTGTGGGGSGDGEGETGPKECGTPGKPKCQIDETGTPADGKTVFDTAGTALDTAVETYKDTLGEVASDNGKDTSWGWMPALPQGTCTPFQFGLLGVVDWCASASSIQEVMAHLWGLVTVIFILGMTSTAIKGK